MTTEARSDERYCCDYCSARFCLPHLLELEGTAMTAKERLEQWARDFEAAAHEVPKGIKSTILMTRAQEVRQYASRLAAQADAPGDDFTNDPPGARKWIRQLVSARASGNKPAAHEIQSSDGGSRQQPFVPADAAGEASAPNAPSGKQEGRTGFEIGASQTPGSSMSSAVAKPIIAGQASGPSETNSISPQRAPEPFQSRGRHYDIILEALAAYDEWMLDDDYDAGVTLRKIMDRMRERVGMTDAPADTRPQPPQGVREVSVRAIQLSYARKDLEPTSEVTLALYREDAEHAADAVLAALSEGKPGGEETIVVPKSALAWLFGDAPDADGKWFGHNQPLSSSAAHRPYWWRSKFRSMVPALTRPDGGEA
jgi:hypothetical protein